MEFMQIRDKNDLILFLCLMLFLCFIYIIYLLLTKQNDFRELEEELENTTHRLLIKFNNNLEEGINKFEDDFNIQLKRMLQSSRNVFASFDNEFNKLNKTQLSFNKKLQELHTINLQLAQEIRVRDAIIERKTKQIKRLKNDY